MKQIIGYCIRICNECEIFKVTQADDDQKRAVMADDFSEMFDQNFKPEDINCDGCDVQGGRLFKFAEKCSVRNNEINHPKTVDTQHIPRQGDVEIPK